MSPTAPPVIHPTTVRGATITGTGMALPPRRVTNDDLAKFVDTNDEWIVQRTGIRQRFISDNGQGTSDLAAEAVRNALTSARLTPADLDLVICATMTQEMICPGTACQIVAKLGAVPCGAFDINVACSGFVAALNIAASLARTGAYRHIAVVGAEQLSKIINWEDRNTCVLFGDGAGAAIISATDDPRQGCIYQSLNSNAEQWQELYVPRDEHQLPPESPSRAWSGKYNTLQMNGREVYKFAVTTLQATIDKAMKTCGLSAADVALVIPHQSNARILESAREKLGFPPEKLYINLERFGNTSAASVGLCLHELWEAGRMKHGDTVIFVGLGGGLTWASSVWRL